MVTIVGARRLGNVFGIHQGFLTSRLARCPLRAMNRLCAGDTGRIKTAVRGKNHSGLCRPYVTGAGRWYCAVGAY